MVDKSTTVHIKPFFHVHHTIKLGPDVALEFMNMPAFGFFLRLSKDKQRLRLHYSSLLWIMEQEEAMGHHEPIDDSPGSPLVSLKRFRLFFPMDGFVTTKTTDDNDGEWGWQTVDIDQHDNGRDGDQPENEISLSRREFGLLKAQLPTLAAICKEQEEKSWAGTTGVNREGSHPEYCQICEHFMRCASGDYEIVFKSSSEASSEAGDAAIEEPDNKENEPSS